MNSRIAFFFANPHAHHSYFTVSALSRLGTVILLCPPLQLQLLTRAWKSEELNIICPSSYVFCCQLLSIIVFLLYKLTLCTEDQYLRVLSFLCNSIIQHQGGLVWVHYQDYLQLSQRSRKLIFKDICEVIIASDPSQPNWITTQAAVDNADAIVVPTTSIVPSLSSTTKTFLIAPYGGDKAAYTLFRQVKSCVPASELPRLNKPFLIVARSNSFRKGIDILLGALNTLFTKSTHCNYPAFQLCICGAVQEPDALELLCEFNRYLRASGRFVPISAVQYSQSEYLALLAKADLFVMPSRLEGSSPAALEALWLGIPCILSKQCGVSVFKHGNHGILLESNNSRLLADAILFALQSSQALSDWRFSLVADRHLFTWHNYFAAYRELTGTL